MLLSWMLLLVVLLMLLLQWLLLLPRARRCSKLCVRYLPTLMVRSSFLGLINCSAFTGGACTDLLLLLLLLLKALCDARRLPLHCCCTIAGDHTHLHGFVGCAFDGLRRSTAATAVRHDPPRVISHAGQGGRTRRFLTTMTRQLLLLLGPFRSWSRG